MQQPALPASKIPASRILTSTILASIACIASVACIASTAHADFVYGLNATGSKGIFRIDTATGATTLVASTPSLTASGVSANGLAFDIATNSFYYARRAGGTNFIVRNQGGVETNLGVAASNAQLLSGTFHNGHYWIIPNGSSNTILRCTPTGSTMTQSLLPTAFPATAQFGDIASTASGITYAACSLGFRRFDLNALGAPSVLLNPASALYQIGFGNTGLFAVQGATIYAVNTTTGVRTFTANATGTVSFNDIASIPAPGAFAVAAIAGVAGVGTRGRRRSSKIVARSPQPIVLVGTAARSVRYADAFEFFSDSPLEAANLAQRHRSAPS